MTNQLEDRLRTHYTAVADELHLPPLTVEELIDPSRTVTVRVASAAPGRRRVGRALGAVAAIATVVGGLVIATDRPGADQSEAPLDPTATTGVPTNPTTASSAPTTGTQAATEPGPAPALTPAETLPSLADVSDIVPATVLGTAPADWYRLQPDLDVAWYSNGGDVSMLCLRTPLGSECRTDDFKPTEFGGGPIGVWTAGQQLIVLTLDPGDDLALRLNDGTTATMPVERDPQINWGTARFQLTPSLTPIGLTRIFVEAATEESEPPTTS